MEKSANESGETLAGETLSPRLSWDASIKINDFEHTFGRRLRAAGVTEDDRNSLLGHQNGGITSHYSGAELRKLIEAASLVSTTDSRAGTDNLEEKIG